MKAHIVPEDKIKEDYSLCSKSGIADRADRLYWEGYKHCLDEITDNFPSCEINKQEWVSVKDRLPKKEKGNWSIPVIIYNLCGVVGAFYDSQDKHFETDEGLIYADVTHWMPLPSPPNK